MSTVYAPNNLRRCPTCGGSKRGGSALCSGCAKDRAIMAAHTETLKRLACSKCGECGAIVRPGLPLCRACDEKRKATP